jgi:hypothetical protein
MNRGLDQRLRRLERRRPEFVSAAERARVKFEVDAGSGRGRCGLRGFGVAPNTPCGEWYDAPSGSG